jgi:hypothetical protein
MSDKTYDMVCKQGANLVRSMTVTRGDGTVYELTGRTARMQVRKSHSAKTVLLEASTTNNRINISGADGLILLDVPASVTATLPAITGVYDLVLYDDQNVATTFLEGRFIVEAGVTRPNPT